MILAAVSTRGTERPISVKSAGRFSTGSPDGSIAAAARASSPYVKLRPSAWRTVESAVVKDEAGADSRSAAAATSISRAAAPISRSLSQWARTELLPPVSCTE